MKDLRRAMLLCLLLIGTAACDRATKHFALTTLAGAADQSFLSGTVRLTYHENPGAFLGLGARWRPELRTAFFQVGNGLFLLATLALGVRGGFSRRGQAGLLLFLAGGVSNLIDRVTLGRVIDFLNVGIGPLRTGIFNIADMAIIAGVIILIVEGVRKTSRMQAPLSGHAICTMHGHDLLQSRRRRRWNLVGPDIAPPADLPGGCTRLCARSARDVG